jgi:hypothetical protein
VSDTVFGITTSADQSGFNGVAVGHLPVGAHGSFFGKAGLFIWNAEIRSSIPSLSGSDSGTDLTYGFGFQYDVGKTAVRVEYEHFEDDVGDLLSAGLIVKF